MTQNKRAITTVPVKFQTKYKRQHLIMQKEGRPHSGTLRALINNNLCSISCARRVGVMIYLLLYLCLWVCSVLFK